MSGAILRVLLLPLYLLSLFYGIAVKTRLILYKNGLLKTRELGCRVISVGNITVGGTGKTPTVEFIARHLLKTGFKVAILSRGYKGKTRENVNVVSDGEHLLLGPDEAGDEPCMLAKRLRGVPVLVGSDRYKLGRYASDNFPLDAVILDDGFQHIRLERDLNILVVDGERGFGNGCLLPRGPLREPLSGISRARLILINKSSSDTEKIVNCIRSNHPAPILFKSGYRAERLVSLWGNDEVSIGRLSGARVMALSAIANPSSFSGVLSSLGATVTCEASFRDHHSYTSKDLESVMETAKSSRAQFIVTTEKDAVKLEGLHPVKDTTIYYLEIGLEMGEKEQEFIDTILGESGLNAV